MWCLLELRLTKHILSLAVHHIVWPAYGLHSAFASKYFACTTGYDLIMYANIKHNTLLFHIQALLEWRCATLLSQHAYYYQRANIIER